MHDWMADPQNHVYLEVYFETPSDGVSQLWPGGKNCGLAARDDVPEVRRAVPDSVRQGGSLGPTVRRT